MCFKCIPRFPCQYNPNGNREKKNITNNNKFCEHIICYCACPQLGNFKSHKNLHIHSFFCCSYSSPIAQLLKPSKTLTLSNSHAQSIYDGRTHMYVPTYIKTTGREQKKANENKLQKEASARNAFQSGRFCERMWESHELTLFSMRISVTPLPPLSLSVTLPLSPSSVFHRCTQFIRPTLMGFSFYSRNCTTLLLTLCERKKKRKICDVRRTHFSIDSFLMWR